MSNEEPEQNLTTQCCVCRRILVDGCWLPKEPVTENVTHTYCRDCAKQLLEAFGVDTKAFFDKFDAA